MAQINSIQNSNWAVIKRNGTQIHFDNTKIIKAIAKAGEATGEFDLKIAQNLAIKAISTLQNFIQKELIYLNT